MERSITIAILKMCGKAILIIVLVGIAIGVIGRVREWDTSREYSNAFFLAGCLLIIAGGSSRLGAGQEWQAFQFLYAESFRNMSNTERANFILNVSASVNLMILGLTSGIMLLLISLIVAKMF